MRCKPWTELCFLKGVTYVGSAFALLLVASTHVQADHDSFETSEPSWKLGKTDTRLIKIQHQRVFDESHSGNGSEYLKVAHGQGTYAYIQYSVSPARLIDELNPSLWIKSNHPHLQLFARVVLPRTIDPHTKKPVTVLLPGTTYDDVNHWQQLSVPLIRSQLFQRVPALRSQFGSHLDARQAYIDMIVLNSYSDPGTTSLWLDDFSMSRTTVGVGSEGNQQASFSGSQHVTGQVIPSPIVIRGSMTYVDDRPFFPRVVKHNGEPIQFLAELGFNVIALNRLPLPDEAALASQLGIWFTAPYSQSANTIPANILKSVICWDYGDDIRRNELNDVMAHSHEIRRSGEHLQRPTVVNAIEQHHIFSRHSDICRLDWSHHCSTMSRSHATEQLANLFSRLKRGSPFWINIQTQPSKEILSQWQTMAIGIEPTASISYPVIREQVLRSVALGARGLYFQSSTRLDHADLNTRDRQHAMFLVNREIQLLEPWIAGGTTSGEIKTGDDTVEARLIQTQRARLVFVFDKQEYTSITMNQRILNLSIPSVPITYKSYEISPASIKRIKSQRAGATIINLDLDNPVKLIVLTADPLVRDYLQRTISDNQNRILSSQQDLLNLKLQNTIKVIRTVHTAIPDKLINNDIVMATELIEQSRHRLLNQEWELAENLIARAHHSIDHIRYKIWSAQLDKWPSPVAHPLLLAFETLPAYVNSMSNVSSGNWSTNRLHGGGFESLTTLANHKWLHYRHPSHSIKSVVSMSSEFVRQGRQCLKINTSISDDRLLDGLFAESPMWLSSPPVAVHAGQMVKINGWVNIPEKLISNGDGLLIFDSIGGASLAERFHQTSGWQPFTFLRMAPSDGNVTVTFVMMGIGEAKIDNVSVQLLEQPRHPKSRPAFQTQQNPLTSPTQSIFAPN